MTIANKKMKMSSVEQKTSCEHSGKYYTIVTVPLSGKKKVFWKYFTIVFYQSRPAMVTKRKNKRT